MRLRGRISKVFFTDEVETHALSGVDLEIRKANSSRLPDLRAAANRHCFPSSASWIHRPKANTGSTAAGRKSFDL